MVFSKLRNKTIVAIVMVDENTPHSPKQAGEYSRDKIGVTMIGNTYIIKLLNDSLAVFINNDWFLYLSNNFKIYTFWVMEHNTW